jgi:hypothetical protein
LRADAAGSGDRLNAIVRNTFANVVRQDNGRLEVLG